VNCPLCTSTGGELVWQDDFCRVVLPEEPDYPGFCRVILREHVQEMTDLPQPSRERLMNVVFAVEQAVRQVMRPDKVNLASLGNLVPHLHWHVIPRHQGDRHFPASVWSAPRNPSRQEVPAADWKETLRQVLLQGLERAV
jgi:diadenosine tetraphosphate (Ap4A) HIT family hydrolase